jgi:PTS system fructose-specific IIA component/PTS system nitrogen regulatory IIA component
MDTFEELLQRLGFLFTELPPEVAGSAEAIIGFLIGRLVAAGALRGELASETTQRVLARERLGSTAIGHGVALPHATTPAVERIVGVGTRSPAGVAWNARNDALVHRICLILAPPDRPGDYLRVLEQMSQGLRKGSAS